MTAAPEGRMTAAPSGRIGYLGPPGSFAHEAVLTVPGFDAAVPYGSVPRALAAVRSGEIGWALVPFENSIEGGVAGTLDELSDLDQGALQIAREVLLTVTFDLLLRRGSALADVKRVATHPHAEAQCRAWLAANLPDAEVVLTASTSTAARDVVAGIYDAAIAGPAAADAYELDVYAHDIADHLAGVTRFVIVGPPHPPAPPTGCDRTTLVLFEDDDHAGSLLEMLTEFAVRGVNLTRLESRPTGAGLGSYCFSIDCDGHVFDARVGDTLAALYRVCAEVRFLGSYVREGGEPAPLKRGMSDREFAEAEAWLEGLRRGDFGT
jgi:prephenate dehydratase